jgi:4'-phosphopantetheinyl transferase
VAQSNAFSGSVGCSASIAGPLRNRSTRRFPTPPSVGLVFEQYEVPVTRNELATDQAHIWIARPETILRRRLESRYERLLTAEERERKLRFRFEESRLEYLVTRVLVRTVLSQYVDVAPQDWRFGTQPLGRPEVVHPKLGSTPRFSLSHTRGRVVCLVARDRDVGVDVEDTTRSVGFLEIAERYFSPAEVADLRSLPAASARKRFFEYWTLKESFIKAKGMQISSGLSRMSFDLGADAISASFDGEDQAGWQFSLREIDPDHVLAASLRTEHGEPLRIEIRETVPLDE